MVGTSGQAFTGYRKQPETPGFTKQYKFPTFDPKARKPTERPDSTNPDSKDPDSTGPDKPPRKTQPTKPGNGSGKPPGGGGGGGGVATRQDGWDRGRQRRPGSSQEALDPNRLPVLSDAPLPNGGYKVEQLRPERPRPATVGGRGRVGGQPSALGEKAAPLAIEAGPTARNKAEALAGRPKFTPVDRGRPTFDALPRGERTDFAALPQGRPWEPFAMPGEESKESLGGTPQREGIGRGLYEDSAGVYMGDHTQAGTTSDGNAIWTPNDSGRRPQGGRERTTGPTTIEGDSYEVKKGLKAIGSDPGVKAAPVWDRPDWLRDEPLATTRQDTSDIPTAEINTDAVNQRLQARSGSTAEIDTDEVNQRVNARVRQRRGSTTSDGTLQQHLNVASGLRQQMLSMGIEHDKQDVENMQAVLDNPARAPKTGRMR